jgi:hypothetical protein
MVLPEIRCVGGLDVAKSAHVVCALEVPSGAVRLAEHAHSRDGRRRCPAGGVVGHRGRGRPSPAADRAGIDRQPVGTARSLWEPLYDALTQAGYAVLLREPAPHRVVGRQFGAARHD